MSLVLNLGGSPETGGKSQRIEVADRLTIGRGSDNDLVLADSDRTLSKNHCTILFDGRGYAVTDNSTNGVFLDNAPERLPRGVPTPLREGSVLRLGNYQLTVTAIAPPGIAASGIAASGRPPAPANPD